MKAVLALLLFAAGAGVYGWLESKPTMRRAAMALVAFIVLAIATAFTAVAQDIRVIDGDTFEMDGETIRLWGVAAPEPIGDCMEMAQEARRVLGILLERDNLRCDRPPNGQDRDEEGRLVRICTVGERDIAKMMVVDGLVWAGPRRPSDGFYALQEFFAAINGHGLWATDCRPD